MTRKKKEERKEEQNKKNNNNKNKIKMKKEKHGFFIPKDCPNQLETSVSKLKFFLKNDNRRQRRR